MIADKDYFPWDDGTETECHSCRNVRVCQLRSDPFMRAVYDEITPEIWWCGTCYGDRADDV